MSLVPASMPGRRRFLAYNPLGEEVPPHAAVEWSVLNDKGAMVLRKPDADDSPNAFFNTESSIPSQSYGFITKHLPAWAMYNPADGTPANGESLGTRAGYWQLHRGYEGFLVWGGADGDKVYVQSDLICRQDGGPANYYYGVSVCSCTIPCTMIATIRVAKSGDPFAWSDPIDVALNCGSFYLDCYQTCCDVEDCSGDVITNIYQTTFTSGSGSYVGYDGTYTYRTVVWSSDVFTIEGRTMRAILIVTEFTYPDGVTRQCSYYSGIVELVFDGLNYMWSSIYGYQQIGPPIAPPFGSSAGVVLVATDNKVPCDFEQTTDCSAFVTNGNCGGPIHCGPATVVSAACVDGIFEWHWRDFRSAVSCDPAFDTSQTKCIDLHIFDPS